MNQNIKNKALTLLSHTPKPIRDNFGSIGVVVFLILLGCFPRFMGAVWTTHALIDTVIV
jgi:hypothetical protein